VAEAYHPERMPGIQERFLPEFTLSLTEGVEMTRRLVSWRENDLNFEGTSIGSFSLFEIK